MSSLIHTGSKNQMSESEPKKRRVAPVRRPCDDCGQSTHIDELDAACGAQGCEGRSHGLCEECSDDRYHHSCQDCGDMFSSTLGGQCAKNECDKCTRYKYRCPDCLDEDHARCDQCGNLASRNETTCAECDLEREVDCCWARCARCESALCSKHTPRTCLYCNKNMCSNCSADDDVACRASCSAGLNLCYNRATERVLPAVLAELTVEYLLY